MELYGSSEITVHKLNELREEDQKIQILDVREDTERNHASIKGTIHIKLNEIADRHTELDKEKNIFVICVQPEQQMFILLILNLMQKVWELIQKQLNQSLIWKRLLREQKNQKLHM